MVQSGDVAGHRTTQQARRLITSKRAENVTRNKLNAAHVYKYCLLQS